MAATSVSLSPDAIANLAADFYVSLRAANKGRRAQQTNAEGIAQFDEFLASKGMPRNVSSIRREHVEAYLDYLLNERVDARNGRRLRPATAKNRGVDDEELEAELGRLRSSRARRDNRGALPLLDETSRRYLRQASHLNGGHLSLHGAHTPGEYVETSSSCIAHHDGSSHTEETPS